ncbi:hypothetical protein PUN28_019405 [Cardiocondyla obscurior]|uniref:Uncharacterized protein n=1 Tax=Cardiocondyla obscurior TaxID=286306 RepID=A0AAW2EF28_9HYME
MWASPGISSFPPSHGEGVRLVRMGGLPFLSEKSHGESGYHALDFWCPSSEGPPPFTINNSEAGFQLPGKQRGARDVELLWSGSNE